MRTVTDIQRELVARGFLPEHDALGGENVDGRFGGRTLEAANTFLTSIGRPAMSPPITKTHIAELALRLFPEDYAKPVSTNPLAILWAVLPVFTKGTNMTTDQITGVLRAILTAIGGYLVGKGIVDQATATQVIGALVTIGGAAWSVWSNRPKVISPIGK